MQIGAKNIKDLKKIPSFITMVLKQNSSKRTQI
jgi:hypothetical protein